MRYWYRADRSNVEFCSTTHCILIVTILLTQSVGRTSPKAQYPLSRGQVPPYEVQYADIGVRAEQNGYQDEGSPGNRRLENQVSRITGQDLRSLLQRVDVMLSNECTKNVAAEWEFETNVNAITQEAAVSPFCIHIHVWACLSIVKVKDCEHHEMHTCGGVK
jgi:hypothetical protein